MKSILAWTVVFVLACGCCNISSKSADVNATSTTLSFDEIAGDIESDQLLLNESAGGDCVYNCDLLAEDEEGFEGCMRECMSGID